MSNLTSSTSRLSRLQANPGQTYFGNSWMDANELIEMVFCSVEFKGNGVALHNFTSIGAQNVYAQNPHL